MANTPTAQRITPYPRETKDLGRIDVDLAPPPDGDEKNYLHSSELVRRRPESSDLSECFGTEGWDTSEGEKNERGLIRFRVSGLEQAVKRD